MKLLLLSLGGMIVAKEMRVCISSPPDRANLVAEIFFGDEQWAELSQEQEALELEFYPRRSKEFWHLTLDEVMLALKEAKNRLTSADT